LRLAPTLVPSGSLLLRRLQRRPATELEAENARLRRELASAKLDLEIVKKAAAYFAKESR
jgi:transposase-like protein